MIYARVYLDEVDTREVDLTALLVYGPVDVDGGVLAVVQFVVGIAVAELIQHIVRADAALVLGVLWEARAAEGELVALDPLRKVGLCVPLVLDLVAGVALVVLPALCRCPSRPWIRAPWRGGGRSSRSRGRS